MGAEIIAPIRLRDASPTREECVACGRYTAPKYPFVPKGWTGEYVIVFPEFEDSTTDRDWYVSAFRLLGAQSGKTGCPISPTQAAYVCALRCGNGGMTARSGKACAPFLDTVLKKLGAKYVILLGDAYKSYRKNWSPVNVNDVLGVNVAMYGERAAYVYYAPTDPAFTRAGLYREIRRCTEDVKTPPSPELHLSGPLAQVGIDTEFEGAVCYTLAVSTPQSVVVADEHGHLAPGTLSAVWDLALSYVRNATTLIGHNIYVDIDHLVRKGVCREEWARGIDVIDTYLYARMADENLGVGAYGVEALLRRYFRVDGWKHETDVIDPTKPSTWPTDMRMRRCANDAWATVVLAEFLAPLVRGPVTFTHQIAATLHRLRYTGVAIDTVGLDQLRRSLEDTRSKALHQLVLCAAQYGIYGFRPTNDSHVRSLLYDKIGLQPIATTPSGKYSVAKDALISYQHHPVVSLLLEYNEADRSLSVLEGEKGVVTNLRSVANGVEILPVNIWPLQAKTARRSSTSPNMQNWKQDMRKLVRSRWDGGSILDVDYRSLEPRILGTVANDQRYLAYFLDGRGYLGIATDVWGREVEKGTPEYRTVKEVVLGTNYGAGPKTIGKKLWYELDTKLAPTYAQHLTAVRRLQDKYLTVFSGIQRYMEQQERILLRHQYVQTATGRIRHLPCPEGRETPGFGHLLNMAYNYPIQSLASDITGGALVDVERVILAQCGLTYVEFYARLLDAMDGKSEYPRIPLIVNEIHDELVFDLPPGNECMVELITETMKQSLSFNEVSSTHVPLDVEFVVAPTWGIKS